MRNNFGSFWGSLFTWVYFSEKNTEQKKETASCTDILQTNWAKTAAVAAKAAVAAVEYVFLFYV